MEASYKYILFFIISLSLVRCVPPEEIVLTEVTRDLRDSTLQKIILFQDQQITDSLITFFDDKDPSYRYAAAMAFASTKDKKALDSLVVLLEDPISEVRVAAAYAIGQIGEPKGALDLMNAFVTYDTTKQFRKLNATILEAVGKCAPSKTLELLSTVPPYKASDTLLLEGQAWGIYRFATRKITSPAGTAKMVEFVNNYSYPASARMIAANYLGRAKKIDLSQHEKALIETINIETNPFIKIPLVLGIGKIKTAESTNALLKQLRTEKDYRVKINTIRALNGANYDSIKADIAITLEDTLAVAQTAAQFLVKNGTPREATLYWRKAKEDRPWQVQLSLYDAANKHLPAYQADYKSIINSELRRRFTNAQNPYEKAATLRSLGGFGWNYQFLLQQAPTLQTVMEKSALVESIGKITTNPDFDKTFGISRRRVAADLGKYLIDVFKGGDVGSMAIAAGLLTNENIDYKTILQDSLPIIVSAQKALKLPDATETYNEIQKTIDYFKGINATTPITPEFNHPIDIKLLSRVTNSASAVIQTDKGKIRLDLFPLLAPGTVTNFIQLSESGFFKEKVFHRIAPNFVIQGGCPRGDGYGSLDYSIRSELPLAHYDDEGYIGMASAGNHTEGTQFFITHSPTPHLDGEYTIFGKVTEGMDAVHQMEIGDKIQSVAIRY